MKQKVFYDHLISVEEIKITIESYSLETETKEELIGLADQIYHHRILDLILKHLPKEKHHDFLKDFYHEPHHEKHLEFLKKEIAGIEEKIKEESGKIKKEILSEIKKSERR